MLVASRDSSKALKSLPVLKGRVGGCGDSGGVIPSSEDPNLRVFAEDSEELSIGRYGQVEGSSLKRTRIDR